MGKALTKHIASCTLAFTRLSYESTFPALIECHPTNWLSNIESAWCIQLSPQHHCNFAVTSESIVCVTHLAKKNKSYICKERRDINEILSMNSLPVSSKQDFGSFSLGREFLPHQRVTTLPFTCRPTSGFTLENGLDRKRVLHPSSAHQSVPS